MEKTRYQITAIVHIEKKNPDFISPSSYLVTRTEHAVIVNSDTELYTVLGAIGFAFDEKGALRKKV